MEPHVTVSRPNPPRPPERNLGKVFIVAVAVLILVAVILVFMMWPRPQATSPTATTEQASNEANILARSQQNTSRKNDASHLASGITEYMSNNQGSLPTATGGSGHKIELCSVDCSNDATKSTLTLSIYKADSIHLTISPSIATPDDNNVYMVRQAICTTDGRGLSGQAGTSRQLAILYALDAGDGQVEEHCQDL